MREILFRGKRSDSKEWIYGGFFYSEGKPMIQTDSFYTKVIIETVSEYIGLKDRYGKKIFENDIVKCWNRYMDEEGIEESDFSYGIVEYGNFNCSCCYGVYGYRFKNLNKRNEYNSDIRNCMKDDFFEVGCEVVGNIFDDPELLEKDK